jgi:HupH hydrogenase expression protein, C-terminal conserved region
MSEGINRKLQAIRVRTEASSGNVAPLLHEVRHGLARLLEDGQPAIIDLKGVPLAPGEEEGILKFLGAGEVDAELHTLGRSEIRESSYPGVWIVTHYDEQGDLKARFIEITRFPEILESQRIDMDEGLKRLQVTLEAQS